MSLIGDRNNKLIFTSIPTRHHINPTKQRQVVNMREIRLIPAYINENTNYLPIKFNNNVDLPGSYISPNTAPELQIHFRKEPELTAESALKTNRIINITSLESKKSELSLDWPYVMPTSILTANNIYQGKPTIPTVSEIADTIISAKNYILKYGPIFGCLPVYEPFLEAKGSYNETIDYNKRNPYKLINLSVYKVIGWKDQSWVIEKGDSTIQIPFGNGVNKVALEYITKHILDLIDFNGNPKKEGRALYGGFFIIPDQYLYKEQEHHLIVKRLTKNEIKSKKTLSVVISVVVVLIFFFLLYKYLENVKR